MSFFVVIDNSLSDKAIISSPWTWARILMRLMVTGESGTRH